MARAIGVATLRAMKLLAFELATEACSVALWVDGEVRERFELAPRRHAELALPWADQLLAESGIGRSQLDAIAVGRGPGAFTGVRLAIAIGQGIALALGRPIVPVSTLAALAMRASAPPPMPTADPGVGPASAAHVHVLAAIDARMSEVYVGRFALRDGEAVAIGDEAIAVPGAVDLLDASCDWHGVGSGFSALDGALEKRLSPFLLSVDAGALPHAADIARLAVVAFARGQAVAPEFVEPAYLRNNVALTIVEQQTLRDSRR